MFDEIKDLSDFDYTKDKSEDLDLTIKGFGEIGLFISLGVEKNTNKKVAILKVDSISVFKSEDPDFDDIAYFDSTEAPYFDFFNFETITKHIINYFTDKLKKENKKLYDKVCGLKVYIFFGYDYYDEFFYKVD